MGVEVKVPTLGESVSEATVAKWFKQAGEQVAEDEPLVELETDKVTVEVNAPVAGALVRIAVDVGADVKVGAVLAVIEAGAAGAKPAAAYSADLPSPAEAGFAKAGAATSAAKAGPAAAPKQAPPPAPAATAGQAPAAKPQPAAPAATATPLSPAVRKMVAEQGLEAAKIAGSGRAGRLTKGDVIDYAAKAGEARAQPAAVAAPVLKAPEPLPPRPEHPKEERVRMTKLRRVIAQRLKEAQNTAAILTTWNEVDMSAAMALRSEYKDGFEKKHGVKLGFMSMFVRASCTALKEWPSVNAEIYGDEIVYKNYYHIGVAVGSPQGLVVPVLRDADRLGFAEIERAIADFGRRARDGKLAIDEMTGGTFTISNGGVFGSLMSMPILNVPQSGILGMHKIQSRPVAVGDRVEVRPMMYLALSYDHRIVDGREAVSFLVRLKELVEDPKRILIDV